MLKEFKEFVARGNVIDLAVGIIIGAAFTAIVKSLVDDLVNPIIGLFLGGIDLSEAFWVLGSGEYASLAEATEAGAAVFAYGSFFMAIINFLIIAFVVFMMVRTINQMKQAQEEEVPAPEPEPAGPSEIDLLIEIRDALKKS